MGIVLENLLGVYKWLTPYTLALCIINVFLLAWYALPLRRHYRWIDFLPSVGLMIVLVSLLNKDFTLPAAVLYCSNGLLFLLTVKRLLSPKRCLPVPKRTGFRTVCNLAAVIPIVGGLLVAGELRYNPVSDFRELGYAQAFIQLNERLSHEYPFGDWKQVDWQALERNYVPLFQEAERRHDTELYYTSLRDYLYSFRDGHIAIANEALYPDHPFFKGAVGGGFGISTIQLDNGKVKVSLLLKDSPAEQSGLSLGDEIVTWDGKPAQTAYSEVRWSEKPMATDGDRRVNQGRFMARTAVGSRVEVAYRSRKDNQLRTASLLAYDDGYATLKATKIKLKPTDAPVEGRVLDNGYGYMKIRYFLPNADMPDPAKAFAALLHEFELRSVKGLLLDVRDNPGGDDDMVSAMAAYLTTHKRHYEDVSYYSRMMRRFELNAGETRIVTPQASGFKGKIAVLINNNTTSSGEGLPLLLKGQAQTAIVGFTSTNGSFGVVNRPIEVKMPEGYLLRFPDGRSLDADAVIQGDSDGKGHGGVAPDVEVPLNDATFTAKYREGRDVELGAAIETLEQMKLSNDRANAIEFAYMPNASVYGN